MRTSVGKWGTVVAVRIPSPVLRAARLHIGDVVEIREQNGSIVIEPLRRPEYGLDELVAGITPDNRHCGCDTGGPVGTEVW